MRAGGRRHLTHESQQCVARRISCSMASWRAAKNGWAVSPAHTWPPWGRSERQRPSGAPPGSVPATRWHSAKPTALRRTWARSPSGRRVPQQGPARQRARHQVALRQAYCLAQDLGSLPQRQARSPQPVVQGGRERPPHKRLIVQGQLSLGDFRRPRHPG